MNSVWIKVYVYGIALPEKNSNNMPFELFHGNAKYLRTLFFSRYLRGHVTRVQIFMQSDV